MGGVYLAETCHDDSNTVATPCTRYGDDTTAAAVAVAVAVAVIWSSSSDLRSRSADARAQAVWSWPSSVSPYCGALTLLIDGSMVDNTECTNHCVGRCVGVPNRSRPGWLRDGPRAHQDQFRGFETPWGHARINVSIGTCSCVKILQSVSARAWVSNIDTSIRY